MKRDAFMKDIIKDFIYKDHRCFIRHVIARGGCENWLCGYVEIPRESKYYGIDYDDIPVRCHGGLTFSDFIDENDVYIIGFDCNHYGDNIAKCNEDYVAKQIESIVNQLIGE